MRLPWSTSTPKESAGKAILDHILSREVQVPTSVIGLTSYSDLQINYGDDFVANDIHIYDVTQSDNWTSALSGKIRWLRGKNTKIKLVDKTKVVITIHGINTAGKWQDLLENELADTKNIICKHYKYIHKAPFKILIPFWRAKIVNKFNDDLRGLFKKYPNCEFYFFAHSFGTLLLFKSLQRLTSLNSPNIKLVTLSGSVLKRDSNWEQISSELGVEMIVNDCGVEDIALPFAYLLAPGLGMAGRTGFYGFKGEEVQNRYFQGGHSFFEESEDFYKEYWLPLIMVEGKAKYPVEVVEPNKLDEVIWDSAKVLIYITFLVLLGLLIF